MVLKNEELDKSHDPTDSTPLSTTKSEPRDLPWELVPWSFVLPERPQPVSSVDRVPFSFPARQFEPFVERRASVRKETNDGK